MKYVLVVVLVTTFAFWGCSKKEEEPESPRSYTIDMMDSKIKFELARIPDTLSIPSGVMPKRVPDEHEPSMSIIPAGVDTTATPVRTTPDFTDAGVGMLISKAGLESPSSISTCITAEISTWFAALSSSSAILNLPEEESIVADCSTGTRSVWITSPSQRGSWNATSATIRTNFINAINGYATSLSTEGYYFPCTVVGLNYGASVFPPYIMVQIQRILDPATGNIVEYRIVLIPRFTLYYH
ncbi:MAG: hypothetical protein H7X70_05610 [Candidatus Kapabacteria bacterium]|nr:hypothetical protein [Candidatus Kapabacteria bacterium]